MRRAHSSRSCVRFSRRWHESPKLAVVDSDGALRDVGDRPSALVLLAVHVLVSLLAPKQARIALGPRSAAQRIHGTTTSARGPCRYRSPTTVKHTRARGLCANESAGSKTRACIRSTLDRQLHGPSIPFREPSIMTINTMARRLVARRVAAAPPLRCGVPSSGNWDSTSHGLGVPPAPAALGAARPNETGCPTAEFTRAAPRSSRLRRRRAYGTHGHAPCLPAW
jgi:hypothetical protein